MSFTVVGVATVDRKGMYFNPDMPILTLSGLVWPLSGLVRPLSGLVRPLQA